MPLPERIESKIDRSGSCWVWTASRDYHGYGRVYFRGGVWRSHRAVYTLLVGEIPDGLQLDHLCRHRACVNPAHLEPVTGRENVLRGDTIVAMHAAKTHCMRGHLFDEKNTYWRGVQRNCRECRKLYMRGYRHTHYVTGDEV